MDITLQRILSLIPKDDRGKYIRGSKKDFAISIGYDSGDIVSMWIKGTSVSYKNKLFEIAERYGVSVEWLAGKTDTKNPPSADKPMGLPAEYYSLNDANRAIIDQLIAQLAAGQSHD